MTFGNKMRLIPAFVAAIVPLLLFAQQDVAKVSLEEFDQTPGKGWRLLADQKRYEEAAVLIDRFLRESREAERGLLLLNFHAGQMFAMAERYDVAERRFLASIDSSSHVESEAERKMWNAYVLGTIAFLHGDKSEMQKYRATIEVGPEGPMKASRLRAFDLLRNSIGRSYRSALTEKPNQSLEPTPAAGTSAAGQPLVPAAVVAHL